MSSKRTFRAPKSKEEEEVLIKAHQPKSTRYVTKWALKIFEEWQSARATKEPSTEAQDVQNLNTKISEMTAESLNFWLVKFVQEVCKPNGERYPGRSIYSIISGLQRHLCEANGGEAISLLSIGEKRLWRFRRALDSEMKKATSDGIARKFQRPERKDVSEGEEAVFWQKNLLGCTSTKSLVNTIYFYNGKLFGVRAKEHRNLRIENFKLQSGVIIYTEAVSKTFHGGLNDMKYKPREVRHVCCTENENHYPCVFECFQKYFSMVEKTAKEVGALYLKPNPNTQVFSFHKAPLGINTLNNILPDLCVAAGFERKTSHSLRITTASRLFQNSVQEKLIRQRTGHRSNALFTYEKNSAQQEMEVSKLLGPSEELPNFEISSEIFENNQTGHEITEFKDCEISDEVLSNIAIPKASSSLSKSSVDLSKAVFNNCTIVFKQQ